MYFQKNKKFSDMIMNRYKFGGGIINDTIVHLVNQIFHLEELVIVELALIEEK